MDTNNRNKDELFLLQYFKTLFLKYYESLCIYSYRFTKDADVCEDLVQAVFMELWEKRHELDFTHSLRPLLYRCIHNKAINYIESSDYTRIEVLDEITAIHELEDLAEEIITNDADSNLECERIMSEATACISKLPNRCQQIFKMSRELNLSNKEIAEKLNISVKAVEKQLTKALSELKKNLSQQGYLLFLFYMLIK
jgi:RNA polymerase sigma-70 factor (family 1)